MESHQLLLKVTDVHVNHIFKIPSQKHLDLGLAIPTDHQPPAKQTYKINHHTVQQQEILENTEARWQKSRGPLFIWFPKFR